MPTLPQDIDYGRRPSLDSRRLDRPTGANVALADSVVAAADTFQAVMADRKAKENQLNYALARNEIQQLDLEERTKLAEDIDWATHDKRYSEGFSTGTEAIGQRYNLSGHDRQILDAETNLIHTQGLVQVASRSRVLEVKEARGRYIEGRAKAKASIILADPGARNRIVLGELDAIDAMVSAGFMDEDEAAVEREDMTQDFALSSLLAMPAEERYRVIRDSLAKRRGYDTDGDEIVTDGTFDSGEGPLGADDIRAGKGTNSIADFLHADTAAKMLDAAAKEDKTNKQREASQSVVNRAWARYPEDQGKRMKYIDDNSSGTVQNLAEEDSRQRDRDELNAKIQSSTERFEDLSDKMEHDGLRFKDIPADEMPELIAHEDALKARSKMLSYGEQWAAVTQFRATDDGLWSMDKWNALPNYGEDGKTSVNLETAEFYTRFTEQDHNGLVAEQTLLQKSEGSRILTGGLKPRAMVNNALSGMQFKVEGKDKDDSILNGIKARLEAELRQRILAVQNSTTPPTPLDEQARNKILAEILSPYAFTDTDFFWFDSDFDMDEAVPTWLMTSAQREVAFIDLDRANQQTMEVGGQQLDVEQILRKLGNSASPKITNPTEQNLRRAAWAFLHKIGTDAADTEAEVLRRLRGE